MAQRSLARVAKHIFDTDWAHGPDGPYLRQLTESDQYEAIHYALGGVDVSLELEVRIVHVIARLPKKVAQYAIDRCIFLEALPYGVTLPGRIVTTKAGGRPRWLILFSHRLPAKHADGIIAHEVAHAWLKHDRYSPDTTDQCEVEAANLARQWGFTGIGADPKHHQRLHGRTTATAHQ